MTVASTPNSEHQPLLSAADLRVVLESRDDSGETVVDGVTFSIEEGETVGLLGESGCGKTMTAMAILGLLPGAARIESGSVRFMGKELTSLAEKAMRGIRGREIALISQEPMVALNPAFRVGWQLAEVVRRHRGTSRAQARMQAVELLRRVQLPSPEDVAMRFPHQLSGGMAQRVAIARALAGRPRLLIADEPTTALDVTVQAEILDLIRDIQRDQGMAVLLITHDWGVVVDMCDRALVMYAGEIVESADLVPMFEHPLHPYTKALLAANPTSVSNAEYLPTIPGTVPQPGEWPTGCHFKPRCGYATPACSETPIPLERAGGRRETRCIHYEELETRR